MPAHDTKKLLARLFAWSIRRDFRPSTSYMLATLAIVLISIFRALFVTAILPWLLFVPAILLLGLLTGRGPALYATVLAALAAGISIGSPSSPAWLTAQQWVASIVFLCVAGAIAIVAAELRAAFSRNMRTQAELRDREGFLASVLDASTDCIKVLDLNARVTFMSAGGMRIMEVDDFGQIDSRPWPTFWQGDAKQRALAAVDAARQGNAATFSGQARTLAGNMRWWDVAVSPILAPDGAPERILSVSRDVTEERRQQEQRDQLNRIVEHSADFIGMARLDGTVFFLNRAGCELVGLDPARVGEVAITEFFPPDEADAVRDIVLPAVERDGEWSGERYFRHFVTGAHIPILYSVFQVLDSDGQLMGYGTVTRDFRARKRAQEQQELLTSELAHRLKNVLALVQAVAAQTLRQAQDLASARDALSSRLVALGGAADVLTGKSWSSAHLHDLAMAALGPHAQIGERILISGPDLEINAQAALSCALALHELATNAVKYGALSNDDGKVQVDWQIQQLSDGKRGFIFIWQESGGPEVRQPTRRGFGTTMIERTMAASFSGRTTMQYNPQGLRFTVEGELDPEISVGH